MITLNGQTIKGLKDCRRVRHKTYVVGIGLEVNTQSKTLFTEDWLTVSASAMRLLLWLWVSVLINLHLIAHLAFNIIATLAHHLGLGQLPNSLQAYFGVSDSARPHELAVVLFG